MDTCFRERHKLCLLVLFLLHSIQPARFPKEASFRVCEIPYRFAEFQPICLFRFLRYVSRDILIIGFFVKYHFQISNKVMKQLILICRLTFLIQSEWKGCCMAVSAVLLNSVCEKLFSTVRKIVCHICFNYFLPSSNFNVTLKKTLSV